MQHFDRGLKLYNFARERALQLGLSMDAGKIDQLIWSIQEKEGNVTCFRRREECPEYSCCWQVSCGAQMISG